MKFGKTSRDNIDRSQFIEHKARGSFLDRFKGRTMQISKDGHLGIINSTKIPIKPVSDLRYDNDEQFGNKNHLLTNRLAEGINHNRKQISNYEALTPMNRSNSISDHQNYDQNHRYNDVENRMNKQPNSNFIRTNPSGLRIGLTQAGDNIMRNSYSKFSNDYPKTTMNHSLKEESKQLNLNFNINGRSKAPHTTQNESSNLSKVDNHSRNKSLALKMPLFQKSSFYGKQNDARTMNHQSQDNNVNEGNSKSKLPSIHSKSNFDPKSHFSNDVGIQKQQGLNNRQRRSLEPENDMRSSLLLIHKSVSKIPRIQPKQKNENNFVVNKKVKFQR